VYDTLMASLAAMGVETIPTVGEDFDYNLHMAIQTVPSDEIEEDKVAEEMQAGFTCQGRLVRPALRGCGAPYRRTSWSRRVERLR
jgi:molecular chaperone GrpE